MTRRGLAAVAIAGAAAFAALVALLHALESETNDSGAISEYALGDYGLLMNAAFFSAALGFAALALALRGSMAPTRSARAAVVLLSVAALGWFFLGAGNIDPEGADVTRHGVVHGIGFFLTTPAILAALFVLARAFRHDDRWRPLRRMALASAVGALVLIALAFSGVASAVTFRIYLAVVLTAVVTIASRIRSLACARWTGRLPSSPARAGGSVPPWRGRSRPPA